MKSRIVSIVASVMEVPAEQLDGTSSPDTVEAWDSVKHLALIMALEEEFGIQMSDSEIVRLWDIDSLCGAIERSLAGAQGGRAPIPADDRPGTRKP